MCHINARSTSLLAALLSHQDSQTSFEFLSSPKLLFACHITFIAHKFILFKLLQHLRLLCNTFVIAFCLIFMHSFVLPQALKTHKIMNFKTNFILFKINSKSCCMINANCLKTCAFFIRICCNHSKSSHFNKLLTTILNLL